MRLHARAAGPAERDVPRERVLEALVEDSPSASSSATTVDVGRRERRVVPFACARRGAAQSQ